MDEMQSLRQRQLREEPIAQRHTHPRWVWPRGKQRAGVRVQRVLRGQGKGRHSHLSADVDVAAQVDLRLERA